VPPILEHEHQRQGRQIVRLPEVEAGVTRHAHELIVGHDRMLGDLRPLAYAKLGFSAATLCCHPYDICTALIAREAGCVVETPEGGALKYPLDTTTPVAWMGYANTRLARIVRPVLRHVMAANF
jgi:hypothetical protein